MTTTYQQALDYIHSFTNYELTRPDTIPDGAWDLTRIRSLLALLGDPHVAYPTLHIAGTKGKGSTAAFCAQVCMAAGLKTGLYCSPHLIDFRERIQIDRQLITPEALVRLADDVQPHAAQVSGLTWFELLTALAFWHFAREGVEVGIIEVGLGGRLDATNVVLPLVSAITHLSLEHTELLGDTLALIAAEKAAIIKPGVPAVSAPQQPEAAAVIAQVADRQNSPLTLLRGDEAKGYTLGLPGHFQTENAAVAVAALHAVQEGGLPITGDHIRAGLSATRWRGRFEKLSDAPLVVVDSAHTVASAQMLVREVAALAGGPAWTLIFGCMTDKDAAGMLTTLLASAKHVILTTADHPRAMPVANLQRVAKSVRPHFILDSRPTVSAALNLALDEGHTHILCTGSLAIAGEAIVAWEQHAATSGT